MNPAEITQAELDAASKAEDAHGSHDLTTGECACGADVGYGFFGWYHHWLAAIITAAREAATTPQAHVRGQERPNPANVGTGEGAGLEGAQIGAQEVYARGGPLGGSTTVAVSHVGYCARGHDLYAIDGVTQHIITHAETKSGNWAKATCPNVIAERSEDTE